MQGIVEPGEAIRRARREAGLTQKDLADLSGVSERTVRAIETDGATPRWPPSSPPPACLVCG